MATHARSRPLVRMFGALRRPGYRWWFASQVLSASGTMTQAIALSWLVLQMSSNAIWLAVLTICAWSPFLPLGPWAGALIDRVDRRRPLIGTQCLLLSFALALAVLTTTHTITLWSVFAISLATGVVSAVDSPARQVYVVDLVGTAGIASAVGLYEVIINASRVLGPAVGAVLLSTIGAAACFLVNAVAFVAPLVTLLRNRSRPGDRVPVPRAPGAIRAGLRYVAGAPAIRVCVLLAGAGGMLFNLSIALPVLTTRALHLGGGGFGLLMAAFGVGALPGAALAAATGTPTGRRVRLLAALTGVAVVAVGYAPGAATAAVAMALTGFASIWFIASANTLVQLASAPGLRGRVMAVWSMALPGTLPLTGLITAGIDQGWGARPGFAATGVVLLAMAGIGWRALGRHRAGETAEPAGRS